MLAQRGERERRPAGSGSGSAPTKAASVARSSTA